ncbi:MAG: hypothetical protein V4601_07625 [Pseudomonadota bacterium]
MKILEVGRIIHRLLNCSSCKYVCVDLEFDDEYDPIQKYNDVCTLAHTWDRKLKSNPCLRDRSQTLLQYPDLLKPSGSLRELLGMCVVFSELPINGIGVRS